MHTSIPHSAVEKNNGFFYYYYMKIIVAGSGGREHAICWKLAQSAAVSEIICVPGNGGTAHEHKCRNIDPSEYPAVQGLPFTTAFVTLAKKEQCDYAVIGPENPLADGIADELWAAGIPVVGPTAQGAALEASKDTAKSFMHTYGIACAESATFTESEKAVAYITKKGAPIVVKADGLAAGKGVVVAKTTDEAVQAVHDMMEAQSVGDAGKTVVIEEYLQGIEISILAAVSVTPETAASDQAAIIPFEPARDHKRLLDGARGPNTGGMGAVSPLDDVTPQTLNTFTRTILEPTLRGLIAEKMDYRGFIFFGLMITKDGPKCLEYNVRLGDPETQAVLPRMDSDFAGLCSAIIDGSLRSFKLSWKKGYQVAPVAVSGGYPGSYKKGLPITVNKSKLNETGAKVFYAGAIADRRTHENTSAQLITSGGRVLSCSASGNTFEEARKNAYEALSAISFDDMQYRTDIGLPGAAESN
jgi:phosphoribosylamine---glycine ligase